MASTGLETAKPSISALPVSFVSAPPRLGPLLTTLDKTRVYIVHIDGHPVDMKRQIFRLAVLVNLAILAGFVWRLVAAAPTYRDLIGGAFGLAGYEDTTVSFSATGWTTILTTLLRRGGMIVFDYFMVQLAWTWPYLFFLERNRGQFSSPALWRFSTGFEPKEVVVRRSRNWTVNRLFSKPVQKGGKSKAKPTSTPTRQEPERAVFRGDENADPVAIFEQRVRPAVDLGYLTSKTGYLMLGPEYDLDYTAMIKANRMIKAGELAWADIGAQVLIWIESGTGNGTGEWLVWESHRSSESIPRFSRESLTIIMQKLQEAGKEDLFTKWVAMIEDESSKLEPFTEQRQMEVSMISVAMFSDHGLDFYDFMERISSEMEERSEKGRPSVDVPSGLADRLVEGNDENSAL